MNTKTSSKDAINRGSTYKYKLSPKSKKYACPDCGKRTFVPYLYTDNGDIVDEYKWGRCDRENTCGYNHHPGEDKEFTPSHTLADPIPEPMVTQVYPTEETINFLVKRTKTCTSPFHVYCKSKGIPMDHLLDWGVYTDGGDGELTAFLFQDKDGRVCNIKWFKYHSNGKRDKKHNAHSLKQPPHTPPQKKAGSADDGKAPIYRGSDIEPISKYLLPLFGAHRLSPADDGKVVVLVESEKTAVIASYFYKHFDWVSCGSASGLGTGDGVPDDFKIKSLFNRKVIWLADADKAGRSNSSIKKLKKYGLDHCIVDLHPDENIGRDIADDIDAGLRPDVIFQQETKEKADDEALMYRLPDGVEWEKVKDSIIKYRSFNHAGRLYMVKSGRGGGDYYSKHITNFTIDSLGHIESVDNPRRLVSIKNMHGLKKELEIPTKAFASNTEFTVFIESEGNFQYDGLSQDLKCLRSKLYDSMVTYKEVDTLGWKDGSFFFANGIFNGTFREADKYGFVELDKHKGYFIPALSCINKMAEEDWEDERKFTYVKRDIKLKDWTALFCEVHKDNGPITLAWYFASLFRDIIYRHFKFFPHLFLFGPPGTGKSQVGWSIRAMGFSGIKKPFNLSGGTKVAFHREFSHFFNFPAWFDEYDNAIDYDRVQSLKAAYDGAGHKKSVKDSDKRTKTVPVNSSCMISGQQLPIADVALFKRVILAQFHQTEFTEKEQNLFKDLQKMEDGGLSHITAALMKFRKKVEKEYLDVFDEVLKDFTKTYNGEVEDRILRNMCVIAAMMKLLFSELSDHLPFTFAAFKKLAIQFIRDQMALISRATETNVFWDMVNYLIDQGLIKEEQDYMFRHKLRLKVMADRDETVTREFTTARPVLFIRVTRIIPLYKEHFKRQNSGNSSSMDKGSLIHYLQHQKYYVGWVKGIKFETGTVKFVQDGDYGKSKKEKATFAAYAFDYKMMEHYGIELMRGSSDDNMQAAIEEEENENNRKINEVKNEKIKASEGEQTVAPF